MRREAKMFKNNTMASLIMLNALKSNTPEALDASMETLSALSALDDEGQETCIHCNTKWYSKHYKDGVCYSCQQQGKPGRSIMEQQKNTKKNIKLVIPVAIIIAIVAIVVFL